MSDIQTELKQFAEVFNSELKHYFPCPEGEEKRVVEAMEYSVLNGGKRLRPFLVFEVAKLFETSLEQAMRVGAALEMLHVYSLIYRQWTMMICVAACRPVTRGLMKRRLFWPVMLC